VPGLRRGVRRQFDATRNAPVLMAPERVVVLDEIADAIIAKCDGKNSVGVIAGLLAAQFDAPVADVQADVQVFLKELVDKGLVNA